MDPTQVPWRPLGELLVQRGVLSAAELDRALAEQRRSGRLLGHVLVRRGYVNAASLMAVLAEQHGVEYASATELETILEADGPVRETEWKSEARIGAEAKRPTRERLVRELGFDPIRWGR